MNKSKNYLKLFSTLTVLFVSIFILTINERDVHAANEEDVIYTVINAKNGISQRSSGQSIQLGGNHNFIGPSYNLESLGYEGWKSDKGVPRLLAGINGIYYISYCIEPGVPHSSNGEMSAITDLTIDDKEKINLALAYGYSGSYTWADIYQANNGTNNETKVPSSFNDNYYMATQTIIWEIIAKQYDKSNNAIYKAFIDNSTLSTKDKNERNEYYNQIKKGINQIIPSFASSSSNSAKSIELEWNSKTEMYTTTLTDTNSVLSHYEVESSNKNVTIEQNGNNVTISTEDTKATAQLTLTRKAISGTTWYLVPAGSSHWMQFQSMIAGTGEAKAVTSYLNVSVKQSERTITIKHVDEKTGELLLEEKETKHDGDSYTYLPKNDLTDENGNLYKSSVSFEGVVDGKDLVFEIPYRIPSLSINVDKVEIETSQAKGEGLPTTLTLSKKIEYEEDLSKIIYKIKITDETYNKVGYEENFMVSDFTKKLEFKLPTEYLEKDEKVNYSIDVLLVDNKEKDKFETDTIDMKTHGYTASEKIITNADLNNEKIYYSATVKTERERQIAEVKEYKEIITFDFKDYVCTKTGYGIDLSLNLHYENDISQKANLNLNLSVQESLVDSYISEEFVATNGDIKIPLELTKQDSTKEGNVTTTEYLFEFLHVNVESNTGSLFTDEQVKNSNKNIQYEVSDGGRNFYIPIWHSLGKFQFSYDSEVFGVNLIKIEMVQEVEVYAYMYATLDSDTNEIDELLLEPIYPESTQPQGWTEEELEWLLK